MGAWIEISYGVGVEKTFPLSLPTWERGLKLFALMFILGKKGSLPTWERGLKLFPRGCTVLLSAVAPYMGAWIEINFYPLCASIC